MSDLNINYSAISEQRNKINDVKNQLNELYIKIIKDVAYLKDNWSTKTSETVLMSFQNEYPTFRRIRDNLGNDVSFLDTSVLDRLETANRDITKQIDDHITVQKAG